MPTPQDKTPTRDEFTFSQVVQAVNFGATTQQGELRKFSGVAYSGGVIQNHYFWGDVVFDLDTMAVPAKLPALLDHDTTQRAGFVEQFSKAHGAGLTVDGRLLRSEAGQSVARDSDDGFPWQMSVYIQPKRIEEVRAGTSVDVNGVSHPGPITVFRDSTIVEVSFTATGQDSNTTALAMSARAGDPQPSATITGEATMTPEQIATMQADNTRLTAELAAATQARDAALAEATKFSKAARDTEVQALFKDIGREYKADDANVLAFSAMDAASFAAMAGVMRSQHDATKPAQGTPVPGGVAAQLFSHQAAQGGNAPANQPAATLGNALLANAQARK